MKWRIVLEYDAVVDAWAAYCPQLPGCASAGKSKAEALRNVKEAIKLYLEPSDSKISKNATLAYVSV